MINRAFLIDCGLSVRRLPVDIQFCSNEGSCLFPRGDTCNNEIANIH